MASQYEENRNKLGGHEAKTNGDSEKKEKSEDIDKRKLRVVLEPPAGNNVDTEQVVIVLKGIALNRLYSKEQGANDGANHLIKREGLLNVEIDGQEFTGRWSTNGEGKVEFGKLMNQVVYFGEAKAPLNIRVTLDETDGERLTAMKGNASAFKLLSSIMGVASLFIPGGILLGGIFGTVSKLFSASAKKEKNSSNNQELAFFGSLPLPLKSGGLSILRQDDQGEKNLFVTLEVCPFQLEPKCLEDISNSRLLIAIANIEAEIEKGDDDHFALELAFGSGNKTKTFSFSVPISENKVQMNDIIGFQNHLVYDGPWDTGVPFLARVDLIDPDKLEFVQTTIGAVGDLANSVHAFRQKIGDLTKDEKGNRDERIKQLSNVAQSIRSTVLDFTENQVTLGPKTGIVAPKGQVFGCKDLNENLLEVGNDFDQWMDLEPIQLVEGGNKATIHLKAMIIKKIENK